MAREFYFGLGQTKTWPDFPQAMSLTYDDVLLMPRNSSVASRADVDTTVQFGPYTLTLPIISAPMDTVTGDAMVRALAAFGGIGTLPRDAFDENLTLCEVYAKENIPCVYAVGLKEGVAQAVKLKERGAKMILLDVANGGQEIVKKTAAQIKEKTSLTIIAGNIATYEQAQEYVTYGIDIARVGIGGGGLCTTRLKTGIGVPQLAALMECTHANIPVIADGGIKSAGDVAKAMAVPGVQVVMIGSMFAGTTEAPGKVVTIDGKKMKKARGQASADYMQDNKIALTAHRAAEGISTMVEAIGSVVDILQDLSGGLRSSMSYVGAHNIKEFQERAQFALASNATQRENLPHILMDRAVKGK
jgi:IMP dehydrogenase